MNIIDMCIENDQDPNPDVGELAKKLKKRGFWVEEGDENYLLRFMLSEAGGPDPDGHNFVLMPDFGITIEPWGPSTTPKLGDISNLDVHSATNTVEAVVLMEFERRAREGVTQEASTPTDNSNIVAILECETSPWADQITRLVEVAMEAARKHPERKIEWFDSPHRNQVLGWDVTDQQLANVDRFVLEEEDMGDTTNIHWVN